jgi:HK97 family phage portal protein
MSLFSQLEQRSNLATPERWLVDYFSGGVETHSGKAVTSDSAMRMIAVFSCIHLLSRTVGSLPLYLYRRLPKGGKEKARKHPLFNLIRMFPNNEMTAMRYRSTLQGHLAGWGNCFSYIDWNKRGTINGLWPLRPDRVQVERIAGELVYKFYPGSDDKKVSESFTIPNYYMLHIPGFGFDGLMGYSPLGLAREAIGLGLATEEFGARYFGSGTHPGMVVEHPGKLSDIGSTNLRKSLTEKASGLGKSHQILLLEEGMKAQAITINPEDAQFLETRKFQIEEIARLFMIPPHMIASVEKSTSWGTGIEEQNIGFITHTMRPWLVLWEEEYNRCLLRVDEREEYFFNFDIDALQKGNIGKRYEAYAKGKKHGWLSTNDIREKENMNPVEGGDIYLVPLNSVPADQVGKEPILEPAKPDEKEEQKEGDNDNDD